MLVLQNNDLNIDSSYVVFLSTVQQFCFERDRVPSCGLLELYVLHLFEILHVVACSDGYFGWGVRLVGFEIEVHA